VIAGERAHKPARELTAHSSLEPLARVRLRLGDA
jgi:hypothetical protein